MFSKFHEMQKEEGFRIQANWCSNIAYLSDLRQVLWPLEASASSLVECGYFYLFLKIKGGDMMRLEQLRRNVTNRNYIDCFHIHPYSCPLLLNNIINQNVVVSFSEYADKGEDRQQTLHNWVYYNATSTLIGVASFKIQRKESLIGKKWAPAIKGKSGTFQWWI